MGLTTNSPYRHDVYTIKQFGENIVKIAYCSSIRESGWELDKEIKVKCSVNDEKLSNNLSRAKSTVKEYALCNSWDWWCTFTIDPKKFDRYNLDDFFKKFSKFLNNYNYKSIDDFKVKYLLVPEQHKDGAWHLHGFIKGINPQDLYINQFGYYTWKQYEDKFGFISMDRIQDLEKCSSYILKYMTKCEDKNVTELNRHMYYCSKGLNKAREIFRGNAIFYGSWDWEHPEGYCKIKTINTSKDTLDNYLECIIYDD